MAASDEYYVRPKGGGHIVNSLEFRHSALASPLRLCDDAVNRSLPLSAASPVNPSTSQDFTAAQFQVQTGGQESNALPEFQVSIGDQGASFRELFEPLIGTTEEVEVSWRCYSGPVGSEVLLTELHNLYLRSGGADMVTASVYSLTFLDYAQKHAPNMLYSASTTPGLL